MFFYTFIYLFICLHVCLLATSNYNYSADLHKTFIRDVSVDKKVPIFLSPGIFFKNVSLSQLV